MNLDVPDDTSFRKRMVLTHQTLKEERQRQLHHSNIDSSELFRPPEFVMALPRTMQQFMVPASTETLLSLYDSRHDDSLQLSLPAPLRMHDLAMRSGQFFIPTVFQNDAPLLLYETFAQIAALQPAYRILIVPGLYRTLTELAQSLQQAILRSGSTSRYQVTVTHDKLAVSSDKTGGDHLFVLSIPEEWYTRLGYPQLDTFGVSYTSTKTCQLTHEWVALRFTLATTSRESVVSFSFSNQTPQQSANTMIFNVHHEGNGWYRTTPIYDTPKKNGNQLLVPLAKLTFHPSSLFSSLPFEVVVMNSVRLMPTEIHVILLLMTHVDRLRNRD